MYIHIYIYLYIYISRMFHSKATEYAFFSSAHGIFSKRLYVWSQNKSINLRGLKSY